MAAYSDVAANERQLTSQELFHKISPLFELHFSSPCTSAGAGVTTSWCSGCVLPRNSNLRARLEYITGCSQPTSIALLDAFVGRPRFGERTQG